MTGVNEGISLLYSSLTQSRIHGQLFFVFSIIPYSELALNKALCNEQIPSFRDKEDCEVPRDKDALPAQSAPANRWQGRHSHTRYLLQYIYFFHLNILRCCQRLPTIPMLCYLLKLRI